MPVPQLISADSLARDWPMKKVRTKEMSHAKTSGWYWVLARPMAIGGLLTRARLAWGVFTGRYDALRWIEHEYE
jgi:hypothetical protein